MIEFFAGVATRNITPTLNGTPVFLAGSGNDRRATGVDLPLMVRALAMRADEQTAIIVAVDLIGLDYSDVELVRAELAQREIDPVGVIVTCTHTHSAPDTLGLWGPDAATSGVDLHYLAHVRQAIVEAAAEALAFVCPAQLRAATTYMPHAILDTRAPQIIDDEIVVLSFEKPDGEVIGTILNFACHPAMLDATSTLLSADYTGAACAAVEAQIGGTALYISGALSGVLAPATAGRDRHEIGQAYAEAALAALATAPLVDAEQLVVRRTTFTLPLENPRRARAHAAELLRPRALADGALTTSCTLIDLGPVQILSIPGQPLPALGSVFKQLLPGPLRILACSADDDMGYILPDAVFVPPADGQNPGRQYEARMSIGATTGSRMLAAVRGLVGERMGAGWPAAEAAGYRGEARCAG